jgi:hypothetical protein
MIAAVCSLSVPAGCPWPDGQPAPLGSTGVMALQPGDIVRTESGEVGKVVHLSRMTIFVALPTRGGVDKVAAFLQSQLVKIAEQPKRDDQP